MIYIRKAVKSVSKQGHPPASLLLKGQVTQHTTVKMGYCTSPVGRVQFGVFEKFTSAYLFQIAREKSCDYLLLIYVQKF